ncbi:MAG: glycosyltransferase family 2 protein [Vicinamibacterales bacterium]
MADPANTSIVIPALNESSVIGAVVESLAREGPWHEILVIDDGSTDGTGEAARAAGALVVRHPYNKGNGASVKSGIRRATGDYVLILDGDGQHQPSDAKRLVSLLGEFDLVVGARSRATQASGARLIGNAVLNGLAAYLTGRPIPDLTSGFRAARREHFREFLHLLPNGFSTPTTTTLAFLKAGYDVAFVPIDARMRVGRSKIRFARDGVKFFLILLRVVTIFSPFRVFLPISLSACAVGLAYGGWTVLTQQKIPNGSVLLLMFAVVVFLVGLVSEQIAALRMEGRH